MEIYYKSNTGKIIDFTKPPYKMLADTDLFDYEWEYESRGELNPKITRFTRGMVNKSIVIMIQTATKEEHQKALNNILEIVEKDIYNKTPGRLYVGEFYLSCYFAESGKSGWRKGAVCTQNEFSLISERGMWIKESHYIFREDVSLPSADKKRNLDFPHDYRFDFASGMLGRAIYNTGIAGGDFEITVYGVCLNPTVNIGGHTYRVEASLDTGEYLKINSITKKIYKVKVNGEVVNQFHLRDRDSYVFEKIQPGINAVTWSGTFGVDVTVFEERSEPEWI